MDDGWNWRSGLFALRFASAKVRDTKTTNPDVGRRGFNPELCPLCNQLNGCPLCSADVHKGPCWCASLTIPEELLARLPPELRNKACLCRQCVAEFRQQRRQSTPKTVLARDFYFDTNGMMVFTAEYHLRRGYCCGSGCRHCPFATSK